MAFPKPNGFEQYGAVKLFRQLMDTNADGDLVLRASLSEESFTNTSTASDFFNGSASGVADSHDFVDTVTGNPFTVKEIIVSNDDSAEILCVNFNDDATLSTYKILAGEAMKFTLSEMGGDPITSISFITDAASPIDFRCFAFGTT